MLATTEFHRKRVLFIETFIQPLFSFPQPSCCLPPPSSGNALLHPEAGFYSAALCITAPLGSDWWSIRSPIWSNLTTYPALAVPAPSLESCFQLHCNRFKLLRVLLEYFLFTHHFHSLSFDITFYLLVIIQKHPEAVKWEWLFLQTLGKCARVEEELSKTDSGTTKCAMTALNKEGKWSADDCNNTKPFFCYDGEISK